MRWEYTWEIKESFLEEVMFKLMTAPPTSCKPMSRGRKMRGCEGAFRELGVGCKAHGEREVAGLRERQIR